MRYGYGINIPFYSLTWHGQILPFIAKVKNKTLLSYESHFSPWQKKKHKSDPDLFCCSPSNDTNAFKETVYTNCLFGDIFKADNMKLISRS